MIPLKDENPTKTFPIITVTIIFINILVFLYELRLGDQLEDKISQFAIIPYNLIHSNNPQVLLTLITSLFLHGGFMHVFGNMLYLWVFGNNIEDRLGHIRFLFFYLICGIIATLGYIITASNLETPVLGAIGAISGVLGAYILLYPRARILVLIPFFYMWRIVKIQAVWFLLFWILLQFLYGTTSHVLLETTEKGGVAWFAHIFGFFTGMLFLGIFLKSKAGKTIDYGDDNL